MCSLKNYFGQLAQLIVVEKGTAIVELAISLPFLLLLVAGLVDYGKLLNDKQVISSAARAGARVASSVTLHTASQPILTCNKTQQEVSNGCTNNPDSLECLAQQRALDHLKGANLSDDEWSVKVNVFTAQEDLLRLPDFGVFLAPLTVEIERNPTYKSCVICFEQLLLHFTTGAKATFTFDRGGCI